MKYGFSGKFKNLDTTWMLGLCIGEVCMYTALTVIARISCVLLYLHLYCEPVTVLHAAENTWNIYRMEGLLSGGRYGAGYLSFLKCSFPPAT